MILSIGHSSLRKVCPITFLYSEESVTIKRPGRVFCVFLNRGGRLLDRGVWSVDFALLGHGARALLEGSIDSPFRSTTPLKNKASTPQQIASTTRVSALQQKDKQHIQDHIQTLRFNQLFLRLRYRRIRRACFRRKRLLFALTLMFLSIALSMSLCNPSICQPIRHFFLTGSSILLGKYFFAQAPCKARIRAGRFWLITDLVRGGRDDSCLAFTGASVLISGESQFRRLSRN